ncbi:MAG: TatD family hydrolase [Candidatus Micrarchaeota archaeon]|nr:TatD family hydrolase [Candidatus Micrarchaeota archaeon]
MPAPAGLPPGLVDSHCHLSDMGNADEAVSEAKGKLGFLVTCGHSLESSIKSIEIAEKYPGFVFAVAGISPQDAMRKPGEAGKKGEAEKLIDAVANKNVVAIGEIGLDYHWAKNDGERRNQMECFEKLLDYAIGRNLPVVIHSRNAEKEVIDVLEARQAKDVLLHCFSGQPAQAKRGVELGYYFTVPPVPSGSREKVIKAVPLQYLLLESDAPYLGKTPNSVFEAAELVAKTKGVAFEEVARATSENARKFYRLMD